jgi:hypothetical protein
MGAGAMVLFFGIEPEVLVEHDDWHSHEHLPERLSIPGFKRGSRWTALSREPEYFVLYEVSHLDILASAPYLERLNNPTAWTTQMMTHYRGMKRGLCRVAGSYGAGLSRIGLLIRLSPASGKESSLHQWLTGEVLPRLPSRAGIVSAHLLEAALPPEMTREQTIRGQDAAVNWVLLITGYSQENVAALPGNEFRDDVLVQNGALPGRVAELYQLAHSVTDKDVR